MPTASGDGLYAGEENKTASFDVHVGNRNGDLGVKIEGTIYHIKHDKKENLQ
jgi:hypothetical protein